MSELGLLDEDGSARPERWQDVLEAAGRIKAFFRALRQHFVGREEAIQKILYAFVLREHVLLFGPPGTAKTALAEAVVTRVEGARCWNSDFSRSMSETQVFGDFDVKVAQDTGRLMHRTEESLLQADFANLGELLDANAPLLRALLRVLMEREFRRGSQHLDVPLHSAIANTNISPHEAMAQNDMLTAVVDRFLFWQRVTYVEKPEDRVQLLRQQSGLVARPATPKLTLRDVQLVAEAIAQLPMICVDAIVVAYEELARKFAEERKRPITDRRLVKGLQLMKASALLRGFHEVEWDDLDRVGLVLVDRPEDEPLFEALLKAVKDKGQDDSAREQANAELAVVERILAAVPGDDPKLLESGQLVTLKRELQKIRKELTGHLPSLPAASERRRKGLDELRAKIDEVQFLIDGEN